MSKIVESPIGEAMFADNKAVYKVNCIKGVYFAAAVVAPPGWAFILRVRSSSVCFFQRALLACRRLSIADELKKIRKVHPL